MEEKRWWLRSVWFWCCCRRRWLWRWDRIELA
jgi:hypothetical protein